ncbi:flavanone 3-dioxygenase 3 [Aristolochia californica]|uniref:flavanone 3-dioxygenase 3 n=1 Tax=Aristolochia californica TaxID=171875 RepID=UPI0035DEE205
MMDGEKANDGERRWVEDVDIVSAPVMDLSRLNLPPPERDLLVQDIGKACKQFGLFQAINHGICPSTIENSLCSASAFFDLPTEEKIVFASNDVQKPVRYEARLSDGIDGVDVYRLLLKHYAHPLELWMKLWPSKPSDYREKMGKYAEEVRTLALKLIRIIMESLGLDPSYMQDRFEDGTQVLAVNRYPESPRPGLILGLPPHSDYGCITVLLQGCRGLQVLDPNDHQWKWVQTLPGSLAVHVGDHLEVLTNGRYKSVPHRVILSPERERISIASFHSFAMDDKIEVVEHLVDEQNPRAYIASSVREFLDFTSRNGISSTGSYIDSLKIPNK